jgi:aminotransferase class I and II
MVDAVIDDAYLARWGPSPAGRACAEASSTTKRSVPPLLAGHGTIFLDRTTTSARWKELLAAGLPDPRVVCLDGIDHMTGNAADLPAVARLVREHDALLCVDDSHGFGVVGERSSDEPCEYGVSGNGIDRHLVLVAARGRGVPDDAQAGAEDGRTGLRDIRSGAAAA